MSILLKTVVSDQWLVVSEEKTGKHQRWER